MEEVCQIRGRVLDIGMVMKGELVIVKETQNCGNSDSNAQRNTRIIKRVNNTKGEHEAPWQTSYRSTEWFDWKWRTLWYNGHIHEKAAVQLFQINKDLKLFSEDNDKLLICEIKRQVIPFNLKHSPEANSTQAVMTHLTKKESLPSVERSQISVT